MAQDFGTITCDAGTFELLQDAYPENYGTDGGIRFYASARGVGGDTCRLGWDTTQAWKDNEAANQAALSAGEIPDDLDYSDACDWQKPNEVILTDTAE